MKRDMTKSSPFSKMAHIGVVVRDISKAIKYLSPLCPGPFEPFATNRSMKDLLLRGKPCDFKLNIVTAKMGPIQIELLQPVSGESPHKEFLESKGEGIHHVAFYVDDLDGEIVNLTRQGYKVLWSGHWTDGEGGFAYLEANKDSNIVVELMQGF